MDEPAKRGTTFLAIFRHFLGLSLCVCVCLCVCLCSCRCLAAAFTVPFIVRFALLVSHLRGRGVDPDHVPAFAGIVSAKLRVTEHPLRPASVGAFESVHVQQPLEGQELTVTKDGGEDLFKSHFIVDVETLTVFRKPGNLLLLCVLEREEQAVQFHWK